MFYLIFIPLFCWFYSSIELQDVEAPATVPQLPTIQSIERLEAPETIPALPNFKSRRPESRPISVQIAHFLNGIKGVSQAWTIQKTSQT